jgi:hypothetical protein
VKLPSGLYVHPKDQDPGCTYWYGPHRASEVIQLKLDPRWDGTVHLVTRLRSSGAGFATEDIREDVLLELARVEAWSRRR